MKNKILLSLVTAAACSSALFGVSATYDTLYLRSGAPVLYWDDETYTGGTHTNYQWYANVGINADASSNYWYLWDYMHANRMIELHGSDNSYRSLYVDSSGDVFLGENRFFLDYSTGNVGIGTTTPADDLHVAGTGDIILDDGNQWKFWNDSGSFGIRDMTGGFNPLVIKDNTGEIGIGTNSPAARLDVRGTIMSNDEITASYSGSYPAGDGMKRVFRGISNNTAGGSYGSDAGFTLRNEVHDREWLFRTFSDGRGFSVTQLNTGGPEFYVNNLTGDYRDAKMVLGNGFYVDENGQAHNASSRSYKENIVGLDTDKAMEAFDKMQTVTYNFKKDKSKEHMVGFIAEDVPDLVATKDRKTVDPLKIVALLNAVVHAQKEELAETKAELAKANEKIDRLEAMQERLTRLETILSNVAHSEALENKDAVSLIEK